MLILEIALVALDCATLVAPGRVAPGMRIISTTMRRFVPAGWQHWASLVGVFGAYFGFLATSGDFQALPSAATAVLALVELYLLAWIHPHLDAAITTNGSRLRPWARYVLWCVLLGCAGWILVRGAQMLVAG